jgi:2-hydroxy-3-keto-5-methylthiopentenyl-1-phosphate phosphatase
LHEFLNPNIIPSKKYDKPQYKIVPVLLSGCYENNLDFVKFFLFQDLSNVESVTGSKSPELLQKCLKIAIDKNYNKIVKFLNENNVIFRM